MSRVCNPFILPQRTNETRDLRPLLWQLVTSWAVQRSLKIDLVVIFNTFVVASLSDHEQCPMQNHGPFEGGVVDFQLGRLLNVKRHAAREPAV